MEQKEENNTSKKNVNIYEFDIEMVVPNTLKHIEINLTFWLSSKKVKKLKSLVKTWNRKKKINILKKMY